MPLTVALSIVIASVCAAIIIVSYYYRLSFAKFEVQDKLKRNADSGIAYLLGQSDLLENDSPYYLDLFDDGSDSVEVIKKRWGFYDLGVVKAYQGDHMSIKAALIGYEPTSKGRCALYLSDERRPLSIAGNTLINGDAYLPEAGIRTTYINRRGYDKKELVFGRRFTSADDLPTVNEGVAHAIRNLCLQTSHSELKVIDYVYDSMDQSFASGPVYFNGGDQFNLTQSIRGAVVVRSQSAVVIGAEAKLEDVIISAPYIEVEDGFEGQVQLFARDSVIVGKNCRLRYPSAVAVFSNGSEAFLKVGHGTLIQGILYVDGEPKPYEGRRLYIDKEAIILGQVFCDGFVEHKGTIKGNLTCRKFLLQLEYSVYENHLFDGIIDSQSLPDYYLGSGLWEYQNIRRVVKWLN